MRRTLAQINRKPHLAFNPYYKVWAMHGWARDLKPFGDWCRAMDAKRLRLVEGL